MPPPVERTFTQGVQPSIDYRNDPDFIEQPNGHFLRDNADGTTTRVIPNCPCCMGSQCPPESCWPVQGPGQQNRTVRLFGDFFGIANGTGSVGGLPFPCQVGTLVNQAFDSDVNVPGDDPSVNATIDFDPITGCILCVQGSALSHKECNSQIAGFPTSDFTQVVTATLEFRTVSADDGCYIIFNASASVENSWRFFPGDTAQVRRYTVATRYFEGTSLGCPFNFNGNAPFGAPGWQNANNVLNWNGTITGNPFSGSPVNQFPTAEWNYNFEPGGIVPPSHEFYADFTGFGVNFNVAIT